MKTQKSVFTLLSIFLISTIVVFAGKTTFISSNNKDLNGKDTLKDNPHIDIKVNKEYDENGNVIRYDSSYTYIYTHSGGRTEELNIDSIFGSFKPYFFNRGFDLMKDPFDQFFEKDTFYQNHFFDNDFFMQQFQNEMFRFEDMMREMDSLRNRFLHEMYPEIKQAPDKSKKKNTKGTVEI